MRFVKPKGTCDFIIIYDELGSATIVPLENLFELLKELKKEV